jgi:hypothetical protein
MPHDRNELIGGCCCGGSSVDAAMTERGITVDASGNKTRNPEFQAGAKERETSAGHEAAAVADPLRRRIPVQIVTKNAGTSSTRCWCTHTGQTSRIVRTMRQQDVMRGGGGSSRSTELTIEQNVTAAVPLLMPLAFPLTASLWGEG